jgi:uncharacterized protein (TIGR02466 family)
VELQTPFVTPIAIFDLSKHLPLLRKLFVTAKETNLFAPSTTGFDTTLTSYGQGQVQNCLPQTEETVAFRQDIKDAATQLATVMGYAAHKYEPVVNQFWFNEMLSGVTHTPHSHYGYHFSGCIYIDMPDNSGKIIFSSPKERWDCRQMDIEQFTVFNSNTWGFTPKEGQLFLWESWIHHSVPAATFEGARRTAGVDVIMNIKQ